jgi:hypothetical protein
VMVPAVAVWFCVVNGIGDFRLVSFESLG